MTRYDDFLVTVGIPTFNRPEGLRITLEAICSQTYRNLEILVSDNCSTDPEVGKVLAEFSVSDPRVRIYRHDTGIAAVFNFFHLLDRASGKYFMWAADDDWWHPDFIEVCVNLLTKSPGASVAVARFQPLPDPSGKMRLIPPSFDKIREIQHPDLVTRLKRYIGQKESFGKAHITYGLFPLDDIRESVEILKKLVNDVMPIQDYSKVDVILNAILLSKGDFVTSEICLRKFAYGPRGGGRSAGRILRGFDPDLMAYFSMLFSLVDLLPVPDNDKRILRRAVKLRKAKYVVERVLRKMFVYRIYWSIYKRLRFEKW